MKKYLISMSIFVILLMFVSSVCASDLNNDTAVINDAATFDEVSEDNEKTDVNLTTREIIGIYGNKATQLSVNVKDSDGNNVSEGSMTFVDVFGKDYTVDVKDGWAKSLVFVGDTGKFNITCKYSGTELYRDANATFLLNVPIVDSGCRNIVATKYGDTVYFSGNVVANYTSYQPSDDVDEYEEITEGNLTVYVDGAELGMCDVDVNGNFVFIWNATRNLIGETINFRASFNDRKGHYNPSDFSKNFTFTAPKDTQISAEAKVIDDEITLISGIVRDESGNAVIGGTLTIDNTYSIPVDANGKFNFYLTNGTISKSNYTIGVIDFGSKADITINQPLMNAIEHTELIDEIIDLCKQGSPYIKFGNGNGKTVVVNVGTHGGELASQVAGFKLIDLLANYGGDINGTIYVFPVIFPEATANNVRIFNGTNLNTVAMVNGSISNSLVKFALSVNAAGLGDFHCTRHSDNDVGITCVMGSIDPTYESYLIADYVSNQTGYEKDIYEQAGVPYAGAIEDYSNLLGLPAITSEVLTNHRAVEYGSPEISFNMMRSFLRYFGFDVDEMKRIPLTNVSVSLAFASPYNYNPSAENVTLHSGNSTQGNLQIEAKDAVYTINYGGNYFVTVKDISGNAVSGVEVTFSLNGKAIATATTNSSGVATISLTAKMLKTAKAGKWNLVIKASKANYSAADKTVKITINKEKTKITAKKKTFKRTLKVKKYAVSLKNSRGNPVKKMQLTIKIGKKTYKAKTNTKGRVTFNLKKLTKKGTYKALIKFKGDDAYKSCTKKVNIKIK